MIPRITASFFVSVLICALPGRSRAAVVISFSGLQNGVNSSSDPELSMSASNGAPIPSNYQPLLNAYPAPSSGVDGGNAGVTITWTGPSAISRAENPNVHDHTSDYDTTSKLGGVDMYSGGSAYSMTFSQPVLLSSFWWTFFDAATNALTPETATISVYTNPSDATALDHVQEMYTASSGYQWAQETRFASEPITKITFSPDSAVGGKALNIDDIGVVVPEPAPSAFMTAAAIGCLLCLRRRAMSPTPESREP